MEIVVRQISGLGNQLFQYAAGLYYATKYKAELKILIDPARNPASYGFPRPFQLAAFRIAAPMRKASAFEQLLCSQSSGVERLVAVARRVVNARLWRDPTPFIFYRELPYTHLPATVYLRAYWQAAGYAEAVEGQLRADLTLRDGPQAQDSQVLEAIASSRCPVSVHLRRGDYVLGPNMTLPLGYYERAWEGVLAEFEGVEFFVFSDDLEFARQNLPAGAPMHLVSHNDGWTAYQDLRLMAACQHHIIANSSFSWWGAWMNPNPEKVVIAPKYWMNSPDSYYPELFPAGWRLLENLVGSSPPHDGSAAGGTPLPLRFM
jgi:Glycosyl transferase family 11